MSALLIQFLIIALLLAVAFNLWLSFRIYLHLRPAPDEDERPLRLPTGSSMPFINGRFLADGRSYQSSQRDVAATVVVFLSTRCADCRKKIPELVRILPAITASEIDFLVVGMEKEPQVRDFLGDTALFPHVLFLDRIAKKSLNPRNATPFYLFVDGVGVVQASGFIGDENWLSFLEQMDALLV